MNRIEKIKRVMPRHLIIEGPESKTMLDFMLHVLGDPLKSY